MEIDQHDIPLWNKFTRSKEYNDLLRHHEKDTAAGDRFKMWINLFHDDPVRPSSKTLELLSEFEAELNRKDLEVKYLWELFKNKEKKK